MERSRARNLQDRVSPAVVPDLSELARRVPSDTAILEYWMGTTSAAVLWISQAGTGVRRWELSADDLQALAALPSLLSNPHSHDWWHATRCLGQKLLTGIPPLQDPHVRHLVIIPDDALARLPFEVLPAGASDLLVERFSIAYLPSASLFTGEDKRHQIRWPWQKMIEAFADPSPGDGDSGAELTTPRAWPRLPEAKREVNGIARVLRGNSTVHIGPQARKEFMERVSGTPVLHLATHAFTDMQNPDQSYIVLAPASRSQSFDYLFLRQVYGLSLRGVDLATISACETDAGKLVRGEGIASFSKALLAAGAHSVVTSLWSVGDRTTAETMLRFYARLAAGDSKSEALRAAKLECLRRPDSSHPAYWAAFVLNGDSRSRLPYVIPWAWLVGIIMVLACAIRTFRTMAKRP